MVRKSGKVWRGLVGSVAQGSDKNLNTIQGQSLKVGQARRKGLPAHARKVFIVTLLALFSFIMAKTGQAQQLNADSNTIVVNLDQPAKYVYKLVIVARLPIGTKPGEIGIETLEDSFRGPNIMVLDREGNVYINDDVNRRVERFNAAGKFQEVVFAYSPTVAPYGPANMAVDSRGHLFLLMKPKETWEVWRGKVLKKHAGEVLPKPWPNFSGHKVIVNQPHPGQVDLSVEIESPSQQKKISFRTKKVIKAFGEALKTESAIFFRGGIDNIPFTYALNLKKLDGKLIVSKERLFPVEMGTWVFAGLSANGDDYALHFDEVDGKVSGRYYCEVVMGRVVSANE